MEAGIIALILGMFSVLFVVLIAFVLLFTLLLLIFTHGSGWTRLARLYPASHQPEGQKYTWQTIRVGIVRYRNCVTAITDPQGLYLSVALPHHPPVFIPWSEFRRLGETRLYWRRAIVLSVGDPRVATIAFPMGLFELIRPHLRFEPGV